MVVMHCGCGLGLAAAVLPSASAVGPRRTIAGWVSAEPDPDADGIVVIVMVGGLCCLVPGIAPGWYISTGGVEDGG